MEAAQGASGARSNTSGRRVSADAMQFLAGHKVMLRRKKVFLIVVGF